MSNRSSHRAFYGNVGLLRRYCVDCRGYAIVKGNEFLCCGRQAKSILVTKKKMMTSAMGRRKYPNVETRNMLLELQDNRCAYCGFSFESFQFDKKNKPVYLIICWDHIEPYSYSFNNNNVNFLASCQICNGIKSNKMFDSLEEIQKYVEERRKKKGYEVLPESEVSLLLRRIFSKEKMAEILFRGMQNESMD